MEKCGAKGTATGETQLMVVGTTLIVLDGSAYYSPSFPRGGLAAVFSVDVSHLQGVSAFVITVEHRDEHDTVFATAGTFTTVTAVGPETLEVKSLKQIVRFKYALTGDPADGVHFIMQAPSWRPYD